MPSIATEKTYPSHFSIALWFRAVAIVSLLSLCGACVIPLITGRTRHRCMHFFIAMAISTLSSDAILHIIPHLLEVHDHRHNHDSHHDHNQHHGLTKETLNNTEPSETDSHHLDHDHDHHQHHGGTNGTSNNTELSETDSHRHDHDHDHHQHRGAGELTKENTEVDKDHADEHHDVGLWTLNKQRLMLLRLSAVMLTIYFIYFVEFVAYYRKQREHPDKMSSFQLAKPKITQCTETLTNHAWKEGLCTQDLSGEKLLAASNVEGGVQETVNEEAEICCRLKARAVMILLGDGVHNFVDGVAIGASFHHSIKLGIITTVAVICHELPHELGDLAVLIQSGLTLQKALLLNLLSALTAFFGLFIIIIIGEIKEIEMLLLAITAGMFIYVAWIDMLAHLKHDGSHIDHWTSACIIQYSGFTVGFVIIFALGWFEKISFPPEILTSIHEFSSQTLYSN